MGETARDLTSHNFDGSGQIVFGGQTGRLNVVLSHLVLLLLLFVVCSELASLASKIIFIFSLNGNIHLYQGCELAWRVRALLVAAMVFSQTEQFTTESFFSSKFLNILFNIYFYLTL